MPVLSLGGMRFQQSWKDLDPKEINNQEQEILQKTIKHASQKGMHHIETCLLYTSPSPRDNGRSRLPASA